MFYWASCPHGILGPLSEPDTIGALLGPSVIWSYSDARKVLQELRQGLRIFGQAHNYLGKVTQYSKGLKITI